MAELADAIDLGSIVHRRAGSSPVIRTKIVNDDPLSERGGFFIACKSGSTAGTIILGLNYIGFSLMI